MDILSIYLNSIMMLYEKSKRDDDNLSPLFNLKHNLDNLKGKLKLYNLNMLKNRGL